MKILSRTMICLPRIWRPRFKRVVIKECKGNGKRRMGNAPLFYGRRGVAEVPAFAGMTKGRVAGKNLLVCTF
jgi:hypothetical protein